MALPQNWSTSLRDILEHGKIPIAQLAKELRSPRPTIWRYVKGERIPTHEEISRINVAAGKLLASTVVQKYLDTAADADRDDSELPDAQFVEDAMFSLSFYFRPGWLRKFQSRLAALSAVQLTKLLRALTLLWGRHLIRNLECKPLKSFGSETMALLAKYGIETAEYMCQDLALLRSRENLEFTIRQALSGARLDPAVRNAIESEILAAHELVVKHADDSMFEIGRSFEIAAARKGKRSKTNHDWWLSWALGVHEKYGFGRAVDAVAAFRKIGSGEIERWDMEELASEYAAAIRGAIA